MGPPLAPPPVLRLSPQEGALLPHTLLLLKPLGSALAPPLTTSSRPAQTADTGRAQ